MATYVNPLDLQNILVNTLSGDWYIFTFLALIVIAFMAARFRMNNIAFFMSIGLFGIMFGFWINWLYAITVMLVGMVTFYVIARLIKN